MSEAHIEKFNSLLEFFHDELSIALKETGAQTSEETEAYLVHLLDGYAKLSPETRDHIGFDKPAAQILDEAIHSDGERRIEIYRALGDASLYSCGFFEARLARRSLSPSYYRRVGRTAYSSLTDMMEFKQPGGIFEYIFRELSAKFDEVVDAFRIVAGRSVHSDYEEIMRSQGFDPSKLLWATSKGSA